MVFAENTAPPGQGILEKLPRLLVFTYRVQAHSQVTDRPECVRVIIAERPAPPGKSILENAPRLLVFAKHI